jgi:hypothetical protein
MLLQSIALRSRSPLEFRSGLLRLIAVVEGEQRLPGSAEMLGPEGVEGIRPLRCEQPWRCERLDLIVLGVEVRPHWQRGARRAEADGGSMMSSQVE